MRGLPAKFGHPYVHGGLGLRQLKTGCFEVRAGLDIRAALTREGDDLVVAVVGTHEDIRWLKSV